MSRGRRWNLSRGPASSVPRLALWGMALGRSGGMGPHRAAAQVKALQEKVKALAAAADETDAQVSTGGD